MPATVLDGAAVAASITDTLKEDILALREKDLPPKLVVIRANDDRGSESYAHATGTWCSEVGIEFALENLPPDASQSDIELCIARHNEDSETSAIMLHLPVPDDADPEALMRAIDPAKDAEGMHPENLAALLYDPDPVPGPCTALGAVKLVLEACPDLQGKRAVVCGRSQIVGRPAALLLISQHATVTVTHTRTADVAALTREADVLLSATGAASIRYRRYRKALKEHRAGRGEKPAVPELGHYITPEMVKPGAVVVDVGVNRVPVGFDENGDPLKKENGKTRLQTIGDVDVDGVREVAGWVTTAKGGTGPMTNAILLRNTVVAAKRIAGLG